MVKRTRTAAKRSGMLNGFEGQLPTPLHGACALTMAREGAADAADGR